ncbi:MAG: DUF4143 domain-containing protein [Acidimicrobiaceae bacterium]|nr:DUF4143 domain-containing protein [Acidimicrobiaceae bacterium]
MADRPKHLEPHATRLRRPRNSRTIHLDRVGQPSGRHHTSFRRRPSPAGADADDAPKRHLADPSLAAAALGVNSEAVLAELAYAGQIFEALAVRDLRVYAQAAQGDLFHYRDSDGLEVDAIVRLPDGRWLAVEVELGGRAAVDNAVKSLRRLADKIDPANTQPPSRLAVLTASGYGFEHPEGVSVVPITVLGP